MITANASLGVKHCWDSAPKHSANRDVYLGPKGRKSWFQHPGSNIKASLRSLFQNLRAARNGRKTLF